MSYLEANLSVPLKSIMSEPISGGRGGNWASILSGFLLGEGGGFGAGSRLLNYCGLGARGCFRLGVRGGSSGGVDNESLQLLFRIVPWGGVA